MLRGTLPQIMVKTALRVGAGTAFTVFWYFFQQQQVSPNAPLVFCGFLFLAGAWFSYLRADGLLKHAGYGKWLSLLRARKNARIDQRVKHMLNVQPHEEHLLRESPPPSPKDASPKINLLANLLAGLLLITASFLFPGISI